MRCAETGHSCAGYGGPAAQKRAVSDLETEHGDAEDYIGEDDDGNDTHDLRNPKARQRRHMKAATDSHTGEVGEGDGDFIPRPKSLPEVEYTKSDNEPLQGSQQQHQHQHHHRASTHRQTPSGTDNQSSHTPEQYLPVSNRVPYFRYFGPTAIVPGFKQMVVAVKDRRRSGPSSITSNSPGSCIGPTSIASGSKGENKIDKLDELPVYDTCESGPVHPLIISLAKTFFLRLGCNYPFLKEADFIRNVKARRVEPILVDAVCAIAARFSDNAVFFHAHNTNSTITNSAVDNGIIRGSSLPVADSGSPLRADYGATFAQRAKAATVDTFPCPSVGAVQACLLMAYEGFGANQDSALWMYLGLAIRMAADLGLQKRVGVQYQGEKDPWYTRPLSRKSIDLCDIAKADTGNTEPLSPEEQKVVEQERMDTFWAVFVLDRFIASGTGRPVTLREDDFDLALPQPSVDLTSGWPVAFPSLIQIISLYGRASDVLNNIHNAKDLTSDKVHTLREIERELTALHHSQDPRLNFNPTNFKAYYTAGHGTTFILMHFWFHALIIILHQPTLLTPFGSVTTHQLSPNSREIAMSSAKTIADILTFSEMFDSPSFIGNPFTSQPMYIAACAFLKEILANTSHPIEEESEGREGEQSSPDVKMESEPPQSMNLATTSHLTASSTPRSETNKRPPLATASKYVFANGNASSDRSTSTKHALLASADLKNYHTCYNALKQLYTYWGGVKYILTALDQKSKGIWDCETYTNEEYESTKIGRRMSVGRFPQFDNRREGRSHDPPIAMTLTGATNSPNGNVTLMYQTSQVSSLASASTKMYGHLATAKTARPPSFSNRNYHEQMISSHTKQEIANPQPPQQPQHQLHNVLFNTQQQGQQERDHQNVQNHHQPQDDRQQRLDMHNIQTPNRMGHAGLQQPQIQLSHQQQQHLQHHYPQEQHHQQEHQQSSGYVPATPPGNMIYDPIRQSLPESSKPTPTYPMACPQTATATARHSPHGTQYQPRSPMTGVSLAPFDRDASVSRDDNLDYQNGNSIKEKSFHGSFQKQHQKQHQTYDQPITQQQQQATYTPTSQHSSNYDGGIPGTSPASTLADTANGQQMVLYEAELDLTPTFGYVGNFSNHLAADGLTFDSQEIDMAALVMQQVQHDMVPPWMEYLPREALGLFGNADGMNGDG